MRGEHETQVIPPQEAPGSSPHARGTRPVGRQRHHHKGIIPACAGNTPPTSPWKDGHRDHPRMRGEHLYSHRKKLTAAGSSPHARGTPRPTRRRGARGGIIPACAGNTTPEPPSSERSRDHPRMRGEHGAPHDQRADTQGSSPHARGTHLQNITIEPFFYNGV